MREFVGAAVEEMSCHSRLNLFQYRHLLEHGAVNDYAESGSSQYLSRDGSENSLMNPQ